MSAPVRALAFGYGMIRAIRNAGVATIFSITAAMAEPVVVAAMGDSLTQGYGLPADQGFVPVLEGWLQGQGADVRLINAGVSGDTTAGGLSRIAWTLTDEVDALIVALGGNDMLRGIDPGLVRSNLDGILKAASDRGVPVLLIGMDAPSNYGAEYETAFDAAYPELAAFYDTEFHPNFLGGLAALENRAEALRLYMQADGIHPNAKGVKLIVQDIGPSVLRLLARVDG